MEGKMVSTFIVVTFALLVIIRSSSRELQMRWWGIKTLVEVILPPHRACPPALWHLALSQWRENADAYFSPQNKESVFEWLEAKGLPPIPTDRFCYEEMSWVHNMGPMAQAAYLKQLREGKIR
jgi:hypothetical protein